MPCVYEGDLDELLQSRGLLAIIDQLVDWLDKAALGTLIDPRQGWEPVRRDVLHDVVVIHADRLRERVNQHGGFAYSPVSYLRVNDEGGGWFVRSEMGSDRLGLNRAAVASLFTSQGRGRYEVGKSVGVFAWPGRDTSGRPHIAALYQPETVVDYETLMLRARDYGCDRPLRESLDWLCSCLRGYSTDREWPLIVVLCARRPFALIGSDSPLELCPYIMMFQDLDTAIATAQMPVRPAAHRHTISTGLLRRMSSSVDLNAQPWVLLGCGSLGSKIAIHLARSGLGPAAVLDKSFLSPHNAARHALLPGVDRLQYSWTGSKADALRDAIRSFDQSVEAYTEDAIGVLSSRERSRLVLPRRSWAVVNTTGSLAVRESLTMLPPGVEIPRVIETSLFAQGSAALLSVEGHERNPNVGDLVSSAYAYMHREAAVRELISAGEDGVSRIEIGEGCGSPTMRLSDGRVSLFAAAMAESIAALQRNGLPSDHGRILLAVVDQDGVSVSWRSHLMPPVLVVAPENARAWKIRISAEANQKIGEEVARWPRVETGGILIGRYSEAARVFYVVDVLPAPEDSVRSASEFVLGRAGVVQELRKYHAWSGGTLYCLGTWHSHLRQSGPSLTDRAAADAMAVARLTPSALLIHTPAGYRAILATGEVTRSRRLAPSRESDS